MTFLSQKIYTNEEVIFVLNSPTDCNELQIEYTWVRANGSVIRNHYTFYLFSNKIQLCEVRRTVPE